MNPEICTVCSSGTVQYICYMVTVPVFFVCVCVWNRLPEADDGGREHHRLNVPLPVATRVRPHSARLPPPLPGRTCAVSHGPPLQWTGWPHQARTATGGTHTDFVVFQYFIYCKGMTEQLKWLWTAAKFMCENGRKRCEQYCRSSFIHLSHM